MAGDRVNFFNEQRGFGLVSRDKGGSVAIHFFTVQGTGFTAMPDGVGVEFAFLGRTGDAGEGVRGQ